MNRSMHESVCGRVPDASTGFVRFDQSLQSLNHHNLAVCNKSFVYLLMGDVVARFAAGSQVNQS